jgi:hypothetical protein
MATPLTKKRFQLSFSCGITVDETINRFMAETYVMMLFQVPTDLLRASVLTNELRDQARSFIRELAILMSIGAVFAVCHDLHGPVIGIKMTLRISIAFEFSTECRGMTPKRLSDVLLRLPVPQSLPDVKPFFIA